MHQRRLYSLCLQGGYKEDEGHASLESTAEVEESRLQAASSTSLTCLVRWNLPTSCRRSNGRQQQKQRRPGPRPTGPEAS